MRESSNRATVTALALMLAVGSLLSWSPVSSHAHQDRQLVQNAPTTANNSKRIALVIGNGAYTSAPALKNPPNDAREMAATLKALGFDVSSGVNVSQREMKRLIREFGQKLKAGGNGLFYYAGHGVQARGRNYIIPIDADIQSEADVEDSGVDVALVLNYMDDAQNGLNIVILDACRNNPFARSFRSASEGLAQVDAPTGTLIAYATAPGRVAADGAGENGLYTSELLKAMRLQGLSATDMFMQVRAEVMKKTGNKQVPWEASSLVGAFYFGGGPTNSSLLNAGPGNTTSGETKFDVAAFEYSYWETIKNSSSADEFKAYLTKYPEGQFSALAKVKIKNLEVVTKPADPEPASRNSGGAELAFWDSVKNSTNAEDFQAYLKKYPNGEFAELANNRLRVLNSALRDKQRAEDTRKAAEEIERQTKTYKVFYGYKAGLGEQFWGATIKVTPEKFDIVADDSKVDVKWTCESFAAATVDSNFIREIACGVGKCRIKAASASEAASVFDGVRQVCANELKKWTDAEASARSYLALARGRTEPIATLGVLTTDANVDPAVRVRVGNVSGAVVINITPGSAAEHAGIRRDDVITALKGSPVSSTIRLIEAILQIPPDTEVEMTILRDSREQQVRARLGSMSAADWQARNQFVLGYALIRQEKYSEAQVACREAIRLKPNTAEYCNLLGVSLEWQKRLAEAEVQYNEAVRLAPTEKIYQDNLHRVQKAQKK